MFSIFKRSRRKRAWNDGKLMGQKQPYGQSPLLKCFFTTLFDVDLTFRMSKCSFERFLGLTEHSHPVIKRAKC